MAKNNSNTGTFHKLQDSVLRDPLLTTNSQKIIYSYYLTRSHKFGRAWPSLNTVAWECRLGRSTVQRAIHHLLEVGYLALVDAGGTGGKTYATNIYKVYKPAKGHVAAPKPRLTPEEQLRKEFAMFKRLAGKFGVPGEVVDAAAMQSKLTADIKRSAPGSIKRVQARHALDEHLNLFQN